MRVHERTNAVEPFLLTFRHIEVHGTLPFSIYRGFPKSLAALSARPRRAARDLPTLFQGVD
jgi:hypothetical protein